MKNGGVFFQFFENHIDCVAYGKTYISQQIRIEIFEALQTTVAGNYHVLNSQRLESLHILPEVLCGHIGSARLVHIGSAAAFIS